MSTASARDIFDDDLALFAAQGALPLPAPDASGHVLTKGASIFHAAYGTGAPVILLHGGLGHSGNWGYQLPAVRALGRQVILIDSRGHGRSTRDTRPYSYEQMARDVLAVMDRRGLDRADLVGWSDGACIALTLALRAPARVASVFFFGCNMDPSGVRARVEPSVALKRCFERHAQDYAALSATPADFKAFAAAVELMMASQPDIDAEELATIDTPVAIVQAEHDEFIRREHAQYLAATIPGARFTLLPGVTHFAPLQRPFLFNAALSGFLSASF